MTAEATSTSTESSIGDDQSQMLGSEPGWFTDPTDPILVRYWDGARWTTQTMPVPASLPSSTAQPEHSGYFAPVQRGPHYTLGFGAGFDGASGQADWVGSTLVTGEVPADYDRIVLECAGGETVDAVFVDPSKTENRYLFIAFVHHRVQRVVATHRSGVSGLFLNVEGL